MQNRQLSPPKASMGYGRDTKRGALMRMNLTLSAVVSRASRRELLAKFPEMNFYPRPCF